MLGVAVLAGPLVGALLANLVPNTLAPVGFWRGLAVQVGLLLAPLAASFFGPVRWQDLRLARAGAGRSVALGLLYSAVYLAFLVVAAHMGLHVSHFDLARRRLGLPTVIALYVPFWAFLEALWMSYVYAFLDRILFGTSTGTWSSLLLGSLLFGILHASVQVVAYHSSVLPSLPYISLGILFFITQSITKLTNNAWGTLIFWSVSNF